MSKQLDQIDTLNNLLAMLAGTERSVTQEIRQAIRFAYLSLSSGASLASLTHCARRLLELHWRGRPVTLLHCELGEDVLEPLWLRARVLKELEKLPPSKDIVMLISGLRKSVAARGLRWTRHRESDYRAARDYLEELCAMERPRGVRLNVIFL